MAEAAGRREGKGRKENPSVVKKAERLKERAKGNRRKAPMGVIGREYDARGGRHAFAGHQPTGRVEVFVFTKRRFRRRAEGLDEHMRLQLQQSAEIRPCIELEKVGETTGRVRSVA